LGVLGVGSRFDPEAAQPKSLGLKLINPGGWLGRNRRRALCQLWG